MSWVGVKEEILSPQQVLSLLPPELWDGLSSVLQGDSQKASHFPRFIFEYCVLHSVRMRIFKSVVHKLKKDGEFYAGFMLNISFSIAQWTQCLPGVQEVVLTGLITRKH